MDIKKHRWMSGVLAAAFFCVSVLPVSAEEVSAPSETVTLDADGIFLKDVLRSLSEQSKKSFIASEEVEAKKVNMSFESVPLEEALQSIATANDLEYQKNSAGVIMFFMRKEGQGAAAAPKTETRIYRLKYSRLSISPIDIGGSGTIQDLVSLQKAAFDSSQSSASSLSAASSSSSGNMVSERGIDKVIASLLTPAGKLTADIQTNSLIVTDIPSKLDDIEKILKEIDRPAPQVLIEVHLMEVKKEMLSDKGIEWGGDDGALGSFTGGSRTSGFPFTENIFNKSKGVKATTQGTSTLTLGTLNANDFAATLHYLTQDVNTKILARPRVLTMSNEAANIKLVTNAAIANTTTLTTADGQASSTSNTAERSQVGITLKMTPQVNEDETVGLFVEPSITTVAASSFFPTTFLDPTSRVVRTIARLKDHQTLVIGGLMERTDAKTVKKIPFLGDLPFAGGAFRYDDRSDADRELVIFITPHIVRSYDSLAGGVSQPPREEVAVRRVFDEYEDMEMITALDAVNEKQVKKNIIFRQEKNHMIRGAQKIDPVKAKKEMELSLQNFSGKK